MRKESKQMKKSWFPEIYFFHLKKKFLQRPASIFQIQKEPSNKYSSNEAHTDPGYSK